MSFAGELLHAITLFLIGFTIFSALLLWIAYAFFLKDMNKSRFGIFACAALLATLAGLQVEHYRFLIYDNDLFASPLYLRLLLLAPPAFFFFSREVLLPDRPKDWWMLVHLLPFAASFVIDPRVLTPLAFLIGAGYAVWLTRLVYGMRSDSRRFPFELFFFSFFAVVSVAVFALGVSVPDLDPTVFHLFYANFTGLAFVLIVAALIVFPELLSDIVEAASAAYAKSTLGGIDVDAKLEKLETLMRDERLFEDENMNLATLSDALDMSSHQLSELINSHFGYGFSRYLREQRVAAAKVLLREDAGASILSISLATGFKSQSTFYAAFKEITGQAPGSYRDRQ